MRKTKKSAVRPRGSPEKNSPHPDGSGDTAGEQEASQKTYSKRPTIAQENLVQSMSTMPPPTKSTPSLEKRKRTVLHSNSSALTGPSRSGKEKETTGRKKKSTSAVDVGNSSEETSGTAHDAKRNVDTSDGESDDSGAVPSRRRKRTRKTNTEFTESDCRKQLASLKSPDKRPPPSMTAESFSSMFCLPNEGINSHKLKIGKDITLEEVQDVFGEEKARNGFSLGEKLPHDLREEAEKLYCLCYQKPYAPTHVAKEFAIGFVMDKVQHAKVNWAEFAAQTNASQWRSYHRRVRVWSQRLSILTKTPMKKVFEDEGFPEYCDLRADKFPAFFADTELSLGAASKKYMQTQSDTDHAQSSDFVMLAARYVILLIIPYKFTHVEFLSLLHSTCIIFFCQ